jgi:O-antigen ligase
MIVSLPLLAGLYLTGSRSVIAAALGGIVVLGFFSFIRSRVAAIRSVIVLAILAIIVMVGSFRWMVGHDIAGDQAKASLSIRGELLRVGARVIATRPVFGVGIDRFFLVAGTVKSPLLDSAWSSRRNPHNDFLRFAGELGLVGLVLFVLILASAAASIWRGLRGTSDPPLSGLAAGLVAFLITSLVSNPLMLRDVSYVFWIALGLAVGRSAAFRSAMEAPLRSGGEGPSPRLSRLRIPAALVLGGVLLVSIPFRATQELATIDPTRVSYGLSDWDRDSAGTRFRWSGPHATVYVSGRARRVEIPLSGTLPSHAPQHVEVRLDGRFVNEIIVGADWQQVGVVLPASSMSKSRRIDLTISPTWVRDDSSVADDRMVVGVKVGELNVIF